MLSKKAQAVLGTGSVTAFFRRLKGLFLGEQDNNSSIVILVVTVKILNTYICIMEI